MRSATANIDSFANFLQRDEFTFALLLLSLIALNLVDFTLTMRTLSLGYREGNPLINYLIGLDPAIAGEFKMGMATIFSLVAWTFRRHRQITYAAIFAVGVYLDLAIYHAMGVILLSS